MQEQIDDVAENEASVSKFSKENALALYLETDCSKERWNILKHDLDEHGHNILPGYYIISQAKNECKLKDVEITETFVKAA